MRLHAFASRPSGRYCRRDPGQTIGEPRYTVELVSFKAHDESGADWSGSDEVFGLFRSTGGYSVRTAKQGDVDSGNSRAFGSQERCLTRQRVLSGSADRGWLIAPDGTRWDCDPRGCPRRSDCGSSSSRTMAATRSFPPVSTRTLHRFATRPTTSSGEPSRRTAPAARESASPRGRRLRDRVHPRRAVRAPASGPRLRGRSASLPPGRSTD